jgi:hypothetical protein
MANQTLFLEGIEHGYWQLAAEIGPRPGEQSNTNKLGSLPGALREHSSRLGFLSLRLRGSAGAVVMCESNEPDKYSALMDALDDLMDTTADIGTPAHVLSLHMGDRAVASTINSDLWVAKLPDFTPVLAAVETTSAVQWPSEEAFWAVMTTPGQEPLPSQRLSYEAFFGKIHR